MGNRATERLAGSATWLAMSLYDLIGLHVINSTPKKLVQDARCMNICIFTWFEFIHKPTTLVYLGFSLWNFVLKFCKKNPHEIQ